MLGKIIYKYNNNTVFLYPDHGSKADASSNQFRSNII